MKAKFHSEEPSARGRAATKTREREFTAEPAEHAEFRYSRTLLAGIQAIPGLDPRLKLSGMTPLGLEALCSDTRQLAVGVRHLLRARG